MIAIDTNVFVYFVDRCEADKQKRASELLHQLRHQAKDVVLLWQVAVEFLGTMRRWELAGRITRPDTVQYFETFESWFDLEFPTRTILHTALDLNSRYSLSHWDSLLVAACIEAGVTTLYSEDMSDGADYDGVRIVNPFRQPSA